MSLGLEKCYFPLINMIIGMNKLVFILRLADAAHGWKSSWKKWSFDWINVGSSPLLNLYIFDFAFIHSVHRKEVDTVKVKNGKDIIAQKEEGREREDREKKKTLSGMSFVWTGQGYCFLTAGGLGGQSGPLIPIQKRGNSSGWHQSSPPTIPATHTHTYVYPESWC